MHPLIQEPFFSTHAIAAPTVQETAVMKPVVSSPVATMNENEKPVVQDPIEPVVAHEDELQQLQVEEVPINEGPKRSQRTRKPAISKDYEVYISEEIQMEGDPTIFEEAIRSAHSSKWLEAMQDEMKSMSTNKVWDLEEIPKRAKTVGCK
jgi:hypothetical protein